MDKVQNHAVRTHTVRMHARTDLHNTIVHCPHYQSNGGGGWPPSPAPPFLLRRMVRSLPMSEVARGFLCIHMEEDRCWASYSNVGDDKRDPPLNPVEPPSCCVIQTEVLMEARLHNLLVFATPLRALVIGVCCLEKVFDLVPWDMILSRLPWMGRSPWENHSTVLLNPGEGENCNPMRSLLWMHSLLSFHQEHPQSAAPKLGPWVYDSLLQLKYQMDREGKYPIVGSALYELHVLDSFVPRDPRELAEGIRKNHEERSRLLGDRQRTPDQEGLLFLLRHCSTPPKEDSRSEGGQQKKQCLYRLDQGGIKEESRAGKGVMVRRLESTGVRRASSASSSASSM